MSLKPLRLVEHYSSMQGEGPRTGVPTQFVRFAGCNLRCPGWPCDTQYAIDPSIWVSQSYLAGAYELFADCVRLGERQGATNITLTGGEPLIQPSDSLAEFVDLLWSNDYSVEMFTNGTVAFPSWINRAQVNMDWKLSGSGEGHRFLTAKLANVERLKLTDMIKFVCTGEDDFKEAVEWATKLRPITQAQFWVGTAWNLNYTTAQLVKDVQQHPQLGFHVNVQVHKYIWPRVERGV